MKRVFWRNQSRISPFKLRSSALIIGFPVWMVIYFSVTFTLFIDSKSSCLPASWRTFFMIFQARAVSISCGLCRVWDELREILILSIELIVKSKCFTSPWFSCSHITEKYFFCNETFNEYKSIFKNANNPCTISRTKMHNPNRDFTCMNYYSMFTISIYDGFCYGCFFEGIHEKQILMISLPTVCPLLR